MSGNVTVCDEVVLLVQFRYKWRTWCNFCMDKK